MSLNKMNKILRHFYRIAIGIVLLIISVYCILIVNRQAGNLLNRNYGSFADAIINRLTAEQLTNIVFSNSQHIDYVIITEGYSLSEKSLLNTLQMDAGLAKLIAKFNQETEGVYLILVKNRKVVALRQFPYTFSISNRLLVAQIKTDIAFTVVPDEKDSTQKIIVGIQ